MLATKPLQTAAVSWNREIGVTAETIRQTGKKASSDRLKWIATILFCTAVVCVMIGQFSSIAKMNLDVENMQQKVADQQKVIAKLNDQKNEISSPGVIIAKARQMGMVSTNPGVVASANKE